MALMPTVHRNGTHKDELLRQAFAVSEALYALKGAMCKAAPSGRDYYVQGADAPNQARDEHRERMALAKQLADYYEALLIHLTDQPSQTR